MNWKMAVLSNWKILLLVVQLSVLVIGIVTPLGDPVDNPIAPGQV